ncbi:MAG: NB-ARC domain-containing protein [Thiotrichaceae bacterium]
MLEEQFSRKQYLTDEAGQRHAVVLNLEEFQTFLRSVSKLMESLGGSAEHIMFPYQENKNHTGEIVATESTAPTDVDTTEYTLEQKISLLKQQHDQLQKMLEDVVQCGKYKDKLDRKLHTQRFVLELEAELNGVNSQIEQLRKETRTKQTKSPANAEFSLAQKLTLLSKYQELLQKSREEFRKLQAEATEKVQEIILTPIAALIEPATQDIRMQLGNLKKSLRSATLFDVPEISSNLLLNTQLFEEIKDILLRDVMGKPRPPIVLQAASGVGKSMFAASLAYDKAVQQAYPDGIYWMSLGQQPDLIELQIQLIDKIEETRVNFVTIEEGTNYLRSLTNPRACLVIFDDVWDVQDILPFNVLGELCQILITTSDLEFLNVIQFFIKDARGYHFEPFGIEQAGSYFLQCVGQKELTATNSPIKLEDVAQTCGYLPLAIKLFASVVRGQPIIQWSKLLKQLKNPEYEFPENYPIALMQALHMNVESLGEQGEYYLALAVFGDYNHLLENVVLMLWKYLYHLTDDEGYNFVNELAARGMIQVSGKIPHRFIRLHSFAYEYITAESELEKLHAHLLAAYRRQCGQHGWVSGPRDDYFFEFLPLHLVQANRLGELRLLLIDFDWMQNKLQATNIHTLLNDYELVEDKNIATIKRTLWEAAPVLIQNKDELANQLLDRLWGSKGIQDNKDIMALLNQAKEASPNWKWQPHFEDK